MARRYQSPRRTESKARTIQDILDAAVRLHGRGITDMGAVAEEAGVSLATVRKYFPTREELFRGCTAHAMRSQQPPPMDDLAGVADSGERIRLGVARLFDALEHASGQVWLAYRLQEESPAMAQSVAVAEAYIAHVARLLFPHRQEGDPVLGFARALLNPVSYRMLRHVGGLSQEEAVRQVARALTGLGSRPQ